MTTTSLRIAVLALICLLALPNVQLRAAAAEDIEANEYALWDVHATLDGAAAMHSRWITRAGQTGELELDDPVNGSEWHIQLWFGLDADENAVLKHALRYGKPDEDATPGSSLNRDGPHHIIRARSADQRSSIELRIRLTQLHTDVPRAERVRIAPVYPPRALAQGMEGVVMLRVDVDAIGRVLSARVEKSTPPEIFDVAALTSAATWPLNPPQDERGYPVDGTIRIPVAFKVEPERAPHMQLSSEVQQQVKARRKRKR